MLRVIIADDDCSTRDKIIRFIDKEKYGIQIVGAASDGAQACAMIREQQPDIVLIDIEMPGMSGLDVINTVYNEYALQSVAFIIVSGHDKFQYAHEALRLGVQNYLLKPFLPVDICNAIYRAARHIKGAQMSDQESTRNVPPIPSLKVDIEYPFNEEKAVMLGLRAGNQESAMAALNAFFDRLPQESGIEAVGWCLTILYVEMYRFSILCKLESCSPALSGDPVASPEEFKHTLADFVRNICEGLSSENPRSPSLQMALKFINAHYAEHLTLERVAAEAYVSPAYLSTLFTQQLNTHFIDYIHRVRVENSIRLMRENPQLKYYQAGERVGYLSYKHYAKCFKKVMNMTVSQYISRLRR